MNSLLDLIRDMRSKSNAIKTLHERLPAIIGENCVKVIKSNFGLQGYESTGTWYKRKDVTNRAYDYARTKKYRTPKQGRKYKPRDKDKPYQNPYKGSVYQSTKKILVQSGNLRDSITFEINGKSVTIGIFPNTLKKEKALQSAHTYAKHLNEGGIGKWGKNTTNTVARQFMPRPGQPPTQKMLAAIEKKYKFELDKLMGDWKK